MNFMGAYFVTSITVFYANITKLLEGAEGVENNKDAADTLLDSFFMPGGIIEANAFRFLLLAVVVLILRGKLVPISRIHQIEEEKERWVQFAKKLQAEREKQMEALSASVHGTAVLAEKVASDED